MRGYTGDENLDEYEDWDEYEDEGASGEEEEREEVVHQPTPEELSYLKLRERLKERVRKESGTKLNSSSKLSSTSNRNGFGSFFGPSQPVIAPRVIQESKSMLENPQVAARVFQSSCQRNQSSSSAAVGSSSRVASSSAAVGSIPRVNGSVAKSANGSQKKSQILKNTRDYSFLLSDDAELPVPKDRPVQNLRPPRSDAQAAKVVPQKTRELQSNNRKQVSDVRVERRQKPLGSHVQAGVHTGQERRVDTQKLAHRQHRVPDTHKLAHRQERAPDTHKLAHRQERAPDTHKLAHRQERAPQTQKLAHTRQERAPTQHKSSPAGLPNQMSTSTKKPMYNGNGPSKSPSVPAGRSAIPHIRKPMNTQAQPSFSKRPVVQKTNHQEPSRSNIVKKQPVSSSKSQQMRPPHGSSSSGSGNAPMKRKPRRDEPDRYFDDGDVSEPGDIRSMIQKLMGYNPDSKKYRERDAVDDRQMEVGFDDVMKEEKRSARVAKQEDDEEYRKIQEDEERERRERAAKKRKLSKH